MSGSGPEASWPGSAEDPAFGWLPGSSAGRDSRESPRDAGGAATGWSAPGIVPGAESLPPALGDDEPSISLHLNPASRASRIAADASSAPTYRLAGPPGATAPAPRAFPRPGDVLARFRIVTELGRGAFARVYLAVQCDLADRPVALKVAANLGDEPRNLARLQHTHIVPIHSVHDDPQTGWRLICMPYVGGANLAQVLRGSGVRLPSMTTGRSLIEALDRAGHGLAPPLIASREPPAARSAGSAPAMGFAPPSTGGEAWATTHGVGTPSLVRSRWGRYFARLPWWQDLAGVDPDRDPDDEREPARRYLRSATYVQAAIWIVARLAEGLQHAHERGLVHRDLKPSNILIAADGTPMLLDFNLSADVRRATADDGRAQAMIGGTLPYMAPEHLDAFSPEGTTPPEAVGPAADLYSLGLILFELVAGEHPFADPPAGPRIAETIRLMRAERLRGAPSARERNPMVPRGLDAILARCLDPDPARRYDSAGDLAEDLRRLLDDRPLKHVPEPSLVEAVAKWARRNPRASSASTIGALAAVLLLLLGTAAWVIAERLKDAEALQHLAAFNEAFSECQLLLNTASGPVEHLGRGLALADAALKGYGLRRPNAWTPGPDVDRLPPAQRLQLREQLSELIALRERARVRQAERRGLGTERWTALRDAVAWLTLAEQIDPRPSFALYNDRARYRDGLGDARGAAADRALAAAHPPKSARDLTLLGTALLALGEADRAEAPLARATTLEAGRFWSWFALGLCHYQQGRFEAAAYEFGHCAWLAPRFSWPYFNRGLALAAAGRLIEARSAYDFALGINPDFLAARLNRALLCLELDDPATALRDLDRVLALGHRDASILAARAEALARLGRRAEAERDFADALRRHPDDPVVLVARGFFRLGADPAGARADFDRALALRPGDARAHLGLARLLRADDPAAALSHLDRALTADPNFADALQLRALIRGRLGDTAAEADADRLERVPTPHRLYNAACALALLHRASGADRHARRALDLLRRALALGFDPATAASDPDLAPLRDRPEFHALLPDG